MLKELLQKRTTLEEEMAGLQEQITAVNVDIEHALAEQLAALRKLQGKEYGAVNLVAEGIKITETIPKKIEWDQEKMNALFDAIAAAGDDPRAYMKMKLEVQERIYDSMIAEVKTMFTDCRTVKPGKPSLKFDVEAINGN